MDQVKLFFKWISRHKKKFLICLLMTWVFLFLMFPFNDLTDLVTTQVSKATGNTVYVKLDGFSINLFPVGLELENVNIETPYSPPIATDTLSVSPSIWGLITKKPAGDLKAEGIFKGNLEVSLSSGQMTEAGVQRQKINIKADQINLNEITKALKLSITPKALIDLNAQVQADSTMQEQPEADVVIKANQFEFPSTVVNTMMGPLELPSLKLSKVELKGKLINGKLNIEEGTLGDNKDDLKGKIKGTIDIDVQAGFRVQPGAYKLDLDLELSPGFYEKTKGFLILVDNFKKTEGNKTKYAFKVSAANFMMPPSFQ